MGKLLTILVLAATILPACSRHDLPLVHRIEVAQGNIVTQDMLDRLEPGMNRRQVRYVMGTPMLVDPFHQDRWVYYYSLDPSHGEQVERQISLYFDGEGLERIEGDVTPAETAGASAAATAPRTVEVPAERPSEGFLDGLVNRLRVLTGDELPPPRKVEVPGGPEEAPAAAPAAPDEDAELRQRYSFQGPGLEAAGEAPPDATPPTLEEEVEGDSAPSSPTPEAPPPEAAEAGAGGDTGE